MIDFRKYFDAAFLINLQRRSDRLQEAEAELQKWNLHGVERVEAVDGQTLSPHRSISLGALGLFYTHLKIIKYAKEQGMKSVLLLEDDCEFLPSVLEFDAFMKEIPTDATLVYFGGHHIQRPIRVSERIVKNTEVFTTHSMIIYGKIFDVIINDLESRLNSMDNPIDLYYSWELQRKYPTYSFFPNITQQRASFSDIENRHTDYSDNIHENLDI